MQLKPLHAALHIQIIEERENINVEMMLFTSKLKQTIIWLNVNKLCVSAMINLAYSFSLKQLWQMCLRCVVFLNA